MSAYLRLMRFDRPIGTYLLLWPVLWSLWLASRGTPDLTLLFIFTLGVIVMRAAGSVINDIFDRKLDSHVKRTQARPIASGELSVRKAMQVFIGLICVATLLMLPLNFLCWLIAGGALLLTVFYPLSKRFVACPQLVLGVVWSMGILMAYAAVLHRLPLEAFGVFTINLLLTVAYDTFYAMCDRDDDLHIGIKSSAILFGSFDKLAIAALQCVVLLLLILLGIHAALKPIYFIALVVVMGLFCYQHYLTRHRERLACLHAFLNNHYVGLVIFLGLFFALK